MQVFFLLAFEYIFSGACAAFAYVKGGYGERLGAAWFFANLSFSVLASAVGLHSPLAHLVEDGTFALGLLPLAMIFVSYWIGLVTLIAAALFTLEAVYLLNDWPADNTYVWINNSLWLLAPIVLLISGFFNRQRARRSPKSEVLTTEAAALGC